MDNKTKLISDIENLLNNYDGIPSTSINPDLLDFMDEETLKQIISSLLDEKEQLQAVDTVWLEKFKTEKNI
jgi:hypothetical protein